MGKVFECDGGCGNTAPPSGLFGYPATWFSVSVPDEIVVTRTAEPFRLAVKAMNPGEDSTKYACSAQCLAAVALQLDARAQELARRAALEAAAKEEQAAPPAGRELRSVPDVPDAVPGA